MVTGHSTAGSMLSKYRPRRLTEIQGHPQVVRSLKSFASAHQSGPGCFVFHGPTGIGKTAAAWALAFELGCPEEDPDLGGVHEIPSGMQDGKAVEDLLRSLRFRPLYGSGWRVAIVNEADRMTGQAETIWLDGLEHLPPRCVVIFTTNELGRLTDRLIRRCEVHEFSGSSPAVRRAMARLVRKVWKAETGRSLGRLPEGLGRFEMADPAVSIALALQQISPYARNGQPLPDRFAVPMIRSTANGCSVNGSAAAKKAWDTRRRRDTERQVAR